MQKIILKSPPARKNSIFQLFSKVMFLIILSTSTATFAQVPGFDDDVNDETGPAAPIDSSIVLLAALGTTLGICFLRKNEKLDKSNHCR
jgi:hypothetical protein